MSECDEFIKPFGAQDDMVYSPPGAISKKFKELTGLSNSILTRCQCCVWCHSQQCIA